jgi:eukaryotic-like serine/threonine-protein kinase
MSMTKGTRFGTYEIERLLGVGGAGEVYRARDTTLNRHVAIKVLRPEVAANPQRLARFSLEAQFLASLNHPHIAQIHGLEHIGGVRALVMELVDGPTLADRIARGAIPVADALAIAAQLADALEAAHEKGIVHQDLKPANIKVRADGTVKVLDFGLAKGIDASSHAGLDAMTSPTLTLHGTCADAIVGTAAYMSPEQARGHGVDTRADIWAFGCVLYEMLSGRAAFPGTTASDHIAAILRCEPDWAALPETTPPSLRRLLRRCLQKELERRLPVIAAARMDIEDAAGEVGRTDDASPVVTSGSHEGVWRRATIAAGVIAVIAIAVAGWTVTRPTPTAAAITFTLPPPERQQYLSIPAGASRHYSVAGSISVSPDGRSVAFVTVDDHRGSADATTGQARLHVRSLGSQDLRMLPGTDGATAPFWSPDGRFIGFVADGHLKKVAVAGGPVVTLAEHVAGRASWGSRGIILYRHDPGGRLYRIADSGGEATAVTTLDPLRDEFVHVLPFFLPDGRRFLFLARSRDNAKAAIYLAALDSDSRTRLVDVNSQPDYSSGYLLYQRSGTVMAQPFDERQGRLTGDAAPVVQGVDTDPFNGNAALSVSANGVLIYRTESGTGGSGRLTWFDRGGKALGTVGEKGFFRYPRVSPDAKHVVATFSKDEISNDLWQIDVNRNIATRFTFRQDDDFWPTVWSPDGERVVFSSSQSRKGVFDLYEREAAGARAEHLLWQSGETKSGSGFSPDGRLLLVDRWVRPGTSDIWALPMTGERKPFPLIQTPFSEHSGVFSPSGRFIAYVSNDSGANQVYVQPFPPTGARVQLSVENGWSPVWTADGRTILYSTSDQHFMAVDVTTAGSTVHAGSPRTLFMQRSIGGGLNRFTVDPSGQRFLLVVADQKPSAPPITVVLNWPSLLARNRQP